MSTITTIAIKHSNTNYVVNKLRDKYVIGQMLSKSFSDLYTFLLPNKGYRTFVIHQERNPNWVQIDYELANVYEFDEILRELTLELKTIAFIAYNQTTSGDFRFALFDKGSLRRSLFLQYIQSQDQIRVMDNYGSKLPFEIVDFTTSITKEISPDQVLDYEVFNLWYIDLDFGWDERNDLEYIHLEVKNFKN